MTDLHERLIKKVIFEKAQLSEENALKRAGMAFMATCIMANGYSQCSKQLQAAMRNPNDPKNAKILAGDQSEIDKKINGANYSMISPEDQALLNKQNKEDIIAAKQSAKMDEKTFKDKFNSKLDLQGERLSKEDRQLFIKKYNDFIARNPSFKTDPSRYTPEERFAFLSKVVMEQSIIRKMNVLFNRPNPYDNTKMSVDDLYKLIQDNKINGFDNFTEKYKNNFQGVQFPDNPHKFD